MFEDASDEAVPAGMDFDLHFSFGQSFHIMKAICLDLSVFECDPVPDLFEIFEGKIFVERDQIYLGYFMAGVGEFFGEFAIISEENQSRSISIKSAHRIDSFRNLRSDDINDGLSSALIAGGGDDISGFVEEVVDQFVDGSDDFAFEGDDISVFDFMAHLLHHHTVDGSEALHDQHIYRSPAGNTTMRQVFVEAHFAFEATFGFR